MGANHTRRDGLEFVFFVCHRNEDGTRGLVFIGTSAKPQHDVKEMQAYSPVPLVYMGAVHAHHYPEPWWRMTLEPWLARGAWYHPTAQVLCLIEDVIGQRIPPPGRHYNAVDTIPEHVRPLTPEEVRRKKWEFPTPDPYALPSSGRAKKVPPSKARRLALRVLASSPEALSTPSRGSSSSSIDTDHLVDARRTG